ncbi:branched-chain amino acid ABC transporter permease [Kaistia dalseonensis]|uniref:Branched-chain amino acid transport system permease protein n=1 Tax=Kaistia dalseonensis TaxID=410840 RepID=A0ABU0H7B8_9HYPH|nr:branched-chain amino acid ABC transporter permease [Kaistia dalseonensis]MCX5495609.1 branched-chain amino acid ABC transporter permease [Kaistia dalseonensis]MDQ0438202.1 branched-chain amino acid transport system permease protein [Kaistia dalseonensis]
MTPFTTSHPRLVAALAVLTTAALVLAPFFVREANLRLMIEIFTVFTFAQSWNFLAGYVGLMSFGQQLFIGLGAYFVFFVSNTLGLSPFLLLPFSFVFCAGFAALAAPFVFRLRDAYFAISIWVIAEVVRLFISQRDWLGSVSGLPLVATRGMDRSFVATTNFYFAAALVLISVFGLYALSMSRLGLALSAVRDNEGTAAAVGINVWWTRFFGFVLGCGIAGMAGATYYMSVFHVEPGGAFDPNWMVVMMFIVIIGGVGTIEGPIIGTAIYFLLRGWLAGTGNLYLMLLGAAAVVVMLVAPKGIWGVVRTRFGIDLFGTRRRSPVAQKFHQGVR